MPNKTISQLPAAEAAQENAVVACDNAAGTQTQKVTLGQIAALVGNPFDQDLNTDDEVQFASAEFVAPAPEGEAVPGIVINSTEVAFPNGTKLTQGSFDDELGGANGVSLYCAVGYELNWQSGRLQARSANDTIGIVIDSPIQVIEGITFADSTEQTTAWTGTVDGLATVATSGDYDDLSNKPTLFDGDYDSLSNKPTLFDGDYDSLTNTPPVVISDPTGITGADAITNIVSLTQAEYDDIETPDAATLYVITD